MQLDNCSVNKCYAITRYAAHLVKSGMYDEVQLCFMIPGHTKFNPDRMFAWLSNLLRGIDIFEINDIVTAVETSRLDHFSQYGKDLPYSVESVDGFNSREESLNFFDWNSRFEGTFKRFGFLNESHLLKIGRKAGKVSLHVQQYSESPKIETEFLIESKKLPSLVRLKKVPLKDAKVNDLRKMMKFIPGGNLSYVAP